MTTMQKLNCQNCMRDFCDDCINPKTCLCAGNNHNKPKITEIEQQFQKGLNKIPLDELKESARQGRRIFDVIKKGKQFKIEILNHEIQTLRPITLLDNDTRMILVYLPTKTTEFNDKTDKLNELDFDNRAFFVLNKNGEKGILPIEDKTLKENFRIKILDSWYESRWDNFDLFKWLDEKTPTDPKKLYNLLDETFKHYLDHKNEFDYVFFNLWNIGTNCYTLFNCYPYNDLTGIKRTGKSKILEFQKYVCYNAIMSADITSSAFFRIIEGIGSTILLDETEKFKDKKNEQAQQLRTLLMQGFMKDQMAIRSEGKADKGFTPTPFDIFSPRSLAHIRAFDDVLQERCIELVTLRSKDKNKLDTWPEKTDHRFNQIRNLSYRLFLDYGDEICKLQGKARKLLNMSGRELKLWTPIITLALFFENHGIKNLVSQIKIKSGISTTDRQLQDQQETLELRILKFLDDIIVTYVQDNPHIKKNPPGWVPVGSIYERLITPENAELFEINPEYYDNVLLRNHHRVLKFSHNEWLGQFQKLIHIIFQTLT